MLRYLVFLVVTLLFSCTKKEILTINEHINETVPNNEAPPYTGVTTVQIQNYVNRLYIDLLGREANQNELDIATNSLKENGLSEMSRKTLIQSLQSRNAYFENFFDRYKTAYLNNVSLASIEFTIEEIDEVIPILEQQNNDPAVQAYLIERDKLENLLYAGEDFKNETIDISGFMARIISNLIYDEINMGNENFVLACFENLFKRLPTENEQERSIAMCEGFSMQLLQLDGNSKSDFITIITQVDEFFQGIGFDIYNQLLARLPNSLEMGEIITDFNAGNTYQDLQTKVLLSDEYAGF